MPQQLPAICWVTVGMLGLVTGSFLNAVIHRLPRGISLLNPRRSFCPSCDKTIPWHENLPVASWVWLRGRCSGCAQPITLRYPLVELLTAGLYLFSWDRFGMPLAPVYWIFLSLLVAATFIDIDHLIIPDEITYGGIAAGLLCATLVPGLLGSHDWWGGLLFSFVGAAFGYLLLWSVVELGKRAFGRKRIRPGILMPLELTGEGGETVLWIDGESLFTGELFQRSTDRVEALCEWLEIDGERLGPAAMTLSGKSLLYGERAWEVDAIADMMPIRAEVKEVILPREAMGFGDVKFLACIGAFLGWKGVLFSLFAGSMMGAVVGILTLLLSGGRSGGRIPFGPYLAAGAMLWIFAGPQICMIYGSFLRGGTPVLGMFLLFPWQIPV